MFSLADYDYHLPENLIAQQPLDRRDRSRLLCLDRASGHREHLNFSHLVDVLNPGDLLVLNNTKVINGRLLGRKQSGGKVEVLILDYAQGVRENRFECLVRASKRPKPGSRLFFEHGLTAEVIEARSATCRIAFNGSISLDQALEAIGHVPLPPYITRPDVSQDRETYQTVYAEKTFLTLHVGYGTFVPVRVADIRRHPMHAEWFSLGKPVAEAVHRAKARGGRVMAVGTTSVRTLEFCTAENGTITPQSGMCDLFIYPGYEFKAVDAMITNFHLPQSTLLMLVSAFAGREKILNAYAEAVKEKYRFFSYGDAMLIS
ncbi:MAG: S-adenosylmethionine:tRNA ribosyltransferase-isomerase [Desulfobacteraceae bacterium]